MLRRVPRNSSSLFVVGVWISLAGAHEGYDHPEPVKQVTDEKLYAPTAMPDRVLLSWKGDPAHSQAITWRTDTSVKEAYVELALAEDGPLFIMSAKRFTAATTPFQSDLGDVHYHAINLTELNPSTLYVYRLVFRLLRQRDVAVDVIFVIAGHSDGGN